MVGDNVELGVYNLTKAIDLAEELELDLVEISPKASPPVCKILDYKKFLYEQKKKYINFQTIQTQSLNNYFYKTKPSRFVLVCNI